MRNIFLGLIIAVVLFFTSCMSNTKNEANAHLGTTHKVEVKEILQASAYTYLKVNENGSEQWIAVPKMEAQIGQIYYFDSFMEMNNFESKDLGRTFESVYFIQELNSDMKAHNGEHHDHSANMAMPSGHATGGKHAGKPKIVKKDIKIEVAKGGISIAELFANKDKYNGKKVLIKGEVVKVNLGIMNKNWFHIQDGTSADGKFDLTVTSMEEDVEMNDIITFEGTVILNKDFGYGYSYEVLLEDAVIKN